MIIAKTPLRVSFFGGGTDLFSFSKREFGCVISTAIDKYVYLVAHPSFAGDNIISYSKREVVNNVEQIQNTRVKEAMKKTGVIEGIEIHSLAEVPSGTGLGSSSAFTVGLLNLLYAYKEKFASKAKLAYEASEIEIDILKEPIGKQDQYACAYGGMNFIKFNVDGSVEIEPIRAPKETLRKINERLVVFYLNKTRDASFILHEQSKKVSSDNNKFNILRKMKEIVLDMKEELNNNRIERFGEMLHQSWLLKKSLTSNISDSYIDEIYQRGIKAGALGGKVLGAGGGGFILFYCEPEKQDSLRRALTELKEFKFDFDTEGTRIIYSQ